MSVNLFIPSLRRIPFGLLALVLMAVAGPVTVNAQTPLQADLALRPLMPEEITAYKLPATTETSPGLTTLGLGQPAYLEAQVNLAIPATEIVNVTWEVTSRPAGSKAVIADSPLGPGVPVFEPSDRLVAQAAGRALLRPDVVGPYVVTASITTHSG